MGEKHIESYHCSQPPGAMDIANRAGIQVTDVTAPFGDVC